MIWGEKKKIPKVKISEGAFLGGSSSFFGVDLPISESKRSSELTLFSGWAFFCFFGGDSSLESTMALAAAFFLGAGFGLSKSNSSSESLTWNVSSSRKSSESTPSMSNVYLLLAAAAAARREVFSLHHQQKKNRVTSRSWVF